MTEAVVRHSGSVRAKRAAAFLGVSESTLWRWAKERADFPKPRHIGPKVTVFDIGELKRFRESCKVAA